MANIHLKFIEICSENLLCVRIILIFFGTNHAVRLTATMKNGII